MREAIITVGLGFGDEGKGATIDHLCRLRRVDLVVRYSGGCQCGHNVELPDGRRHCFAQFGAGTLAGAETYIGPQVVIDPLAMAREAVHLIELGVANPYADLTVHPDAPVATAYHRALNRAKELARGAGRHGSCGMGVGEARSYILRHGSDAVTAQDAWWRPRELRAKLELQRQRSLAELAAILDDLDDDDRHYIASLVPSAEDHAAQLLGSRRPSQMLEHIPATAGVVACEGAQGVLLDEWHGFHPHTTWSTVTPRYAREMAERAGADHVSVLGLTRAFTTRHGAGPLPTEDEELTGRLIDPGNPTNSWQGGFRVGWPDLALIRYAAESCGGVDGLVVSWMDKFDAGGKTCVGYLGGWKPMPTPIPSLERQTEAGLMLAAVLPEYVPCDGDQLLEMMGEVAPVVVTAHGPTHRDRCVRVSGASPSTVLKAAR